MKLVELDNAVTIPLSNEEHEVFEKYVNTNIKENEDIDEREKLLLQKKSLLCSRCQLFR